MLVPYSILLRAGKPLPVTPKVFDTLLVLVENSGRIVGKEELMRRLWPDTFVEEANLTFNVQQLRKSLGDSARHPLYVETVPRRGYRFIADVEEVLSDCAAGGNDVTRRFETSGTHSTTDGVGLGVNSDTGSDRETEPAASGEPLRREHALGWRGTIRSATRASKTVLAVAAVAVILIGGGFVMWRRSPTPPQPSGERLMLAVLPFRNITGDSTQDYFSDGLTEEMITQLGELDPQRLGVIARTSVMNYKDNTAPLDRVGRELGVQYVLEGSVRRDADHVLVAARLIGVRDQTPVWSREYDREARGILVLQREIGQEIAGQVQLTLGGRKPSEPSRQPPLSQQAYEAHDLYLKGQYFWNKRTIEAFQEAVGYFRHAIDIDPSYAPAYVGLADTYALMGGYSMRPQTEYIQQARAAALKALELDGGSAEAHTALALIVQNYDWDWDRAGREFRRAIELNPNYATAHHWYAEHLTWLGRFDEALEESERARQLDPLSLIIAADRGATLYYARRYDRAVEQFRAVRAVDPNFPRVGSLILAAYEQKGLSAEALADVEKWHPPPGIDSPDYWSQLAYAYGRAGQRERAQDALAKLLEINGRQEVDAAALVWACLGAGDQKQALAWLERAYQQHSNVMTTLKVEPRFDPLRSDPRFVDLLRHVGLTQ